MKLLQELLCEICLIKGAVVQAEEVDHVKPISQNPGLRLVYDNLQSLCATCHSKKTREDKKIYIITVTGKNKDTGNVWEQTDFCRAES